MNKLMELVKSRKAIGAVISLVGAFWGWMEGEVSTEVLIGLVTAVVGFWQQAQAKVDAAKIAAEAAGTLPTT